MDISLKLHVTVYKYGKTNFGIPQPVIILQVESMIMEQIYNVYDKMYRI